MSKQFNHYMCGHVLFVQCISTRDKTTGKYLPLMDGNLNVTLNRIYANSHTLESVTITLPLKEDIDTQQLTELIEFCSSVIDVDIKFNHIPFYGSNIDETRQMMVLKTAELNSFIEFMSQHRLYTVVCDFPLPIVVDNIEVVYNYNWSYCSDNEKSKTLKDFYLNEIHLAEFFPTFLYSDVQYEYWKNSIPEDQFSMLDVQRSVNIFSKEYINAVSQWELQKLSNDDECIRVILDTELNKILNNEQVIFYPSRIEDPRYKLANVIELAISNKCKLIITNPTQFNLQELHDKYPKLKDILVDLSEHVTLKRKLYFYILSYLKPTDKIYHFEKDMHISLIEQKLITDASLIIPYISSAQINSYINE